jgi:hypothetical protein
LPSPNAFKLYNVTQQSGGCLPKENEAKGLNILLNILGLKYGIYGKNEEHNVAVRTLIKDTEASLKD